ncbi:MAG: exodeoxyribonuclease large subunit [Actinomycetota bacterium]|jgi:exodeoxyribonuclease VII large subunit
MAAEIEYFNGVPSFSVGQFATILNRVLKASFDEGVWIEGEIEGFKRPNPHAYFSLVENVDGKKVQVSINLFSGPLKNVQAKMRQQGIELKDGLKVRLYGRPEYYGPFGKLNIIVSDIDTQFTVGDIAAQREALLKSLLERGVDKPNKRLPIPMVPLRLGVVSSSQAAGWADAQQTLLESGIGFQIFFVDVRVQGDDAPPQIVAALDTLSRRDDIDLVLLMRGGGSKGDLGAFDDERIAHAIARCAHPVFTGIGHQIDTSIADVIAHTAHKTPTACAKAVIAYVEEFMGNLSWTAGELRRVTERSLERAQTRIGMCVERLKTRPKLILERAQQRIEMNRTSLRLLDPATVLARGWSITRTATGQIIRTLDDVSVGDTIETTVAGGRFVSTVEEKK